MNINSINNLFDLDSLSMLWSFIGDIRLSIDDNIISIIDFDYRYVWQQSSSKKRVFREKDDNIYQDEKGILIWNKNHFELKEFNGTTIVFHEDGRLNYLVDDNGYRLAVNYNNDLLANLSASNGDSLYVTYNSQKRIETITNQIGETIYYYYDATSQHLTDIRYEDDTTSYSYDSPFDPTLLSGVTYGNGSKVSYDYDQYGR